MPKRILIVDEDRASAAAVGACVGPLDVETVFVESGHEAIFAIDRFRPDLILLSASIEGAIDFVEHVRGISATLPLVVIETHASRADHVGAAEAGADDCLVMPADYAVLTARARTLLAHKEAHDELRARNEQLTKVDNQKRELVQFVVHDLKNPLATLHANVAWLMEVVAARGDVKEALHDTESAVRRLQSMSDDLLTITRIEDAALPIHRADVDVRPILDELVRDYGREARHAQLSIESSVPPHLYLDVDATVLRRMLDNLVDNAVRYTPSGGKILVEARGDNPAELCVANTGAPIPLENRERIFRKFERGTRTPTAVNVGIGLYFCKLAAEAHGGSIDVDSTAEWPVRFTLRMPTSRPSAMAR